MWVVLASWIVEDDGIELGEGDRWATVLEVELESAVEADSLIPLGFQLVGDPLSVEGYEYDVIAKVLYNETSGHFLDAGGVILTPHALVTWPIGTVLAFRSALRGGWYPIIPPPVHLIFDAEVRQLFIMEWDLVLDSEPNSYRRDPGSLRFRPIRRMEMWENAWGLEGPNKVAADYLLELR